VLYTILKPLTFLLARLYFRLRGGGQHHVPRQGPLLLVANHSSVLDPPLIGAVAPRPLCFLAKEELFGIPLFGRFIRALNARPLRREGADARALRTALRLLEEGQALLVFPEGTRGDEGTLRPAKPGVGMLAVTSGAPVVPVYITGSGQVWPRGRSFPRPGKVRVTFGAPLRFERPAGSDRKERYETASRDMMEAIAALKRSGESAYGPPGAKASAVARFGFEYIDGRNGQHG
jgi:1-acyl-sn-glycerol-3-phosphate acyltransferase